MKKFFKENFWWLLLAVVTIGAVIGIAYIPDGNLARKMLLFPFYIIGAIIILMGIGEVIRYLNEKNFIKHTWQVGLIFIILVISIIAFII